MRVRDDPATVAWPQFVSARSSVSALLDGFRESERLPVELLLAGQSRQLLRLLRWAATQSRFYQRGAWITDTLRDCSRRPDAFWEIWRRAPILGKKDLRAYGDLIHAIKVPTDQHPISSNSSSGSTGIAVTVRTTAVTRGIWEALTIREHLWMQRNFAKRLGAIRHRAPAERSAAGQSTTSWGPPAANLFTTGPASVIHIGHDIDTLAHWLVRFDPHYLIANPSVAEPLLARAAELSTTPLHLEEIRFIGEPLDPELERRLVDRYRLRVTEIYSANEVGVIAFRCDEGSLHVQSEALLVEILDDRGQPCPQGDTGRVVVTVLHNLATPLIRYDLGDYAIAGAACSCGRTLPVIGQVRGRVRNLARTPDGRCFWPVDLARMRRVPAIRQAQFVQTTIDTIQVNFVADRVLTEGERSEAEDGVRAVLGYPFNVELVRVDEIPRGPTGKFEEFASRLDDDAIAAGAVGTATPDRSPAERGALPARGPSRRRGSGA